MKLAILTSGFKPVPAIKGGAVEQLVTDIVEANEKFHKYDIDLYTLYDKKLSIYKNRYKYTHIIMVRDPQKNIFLWIKHSLYRRLFNSQKRVNYVSERMARSFKRNYYDKVLVENNMDTYDAVYKLKSKEKFYFHLHNDFDNGDAEKTKKKTLHIINTATKLLVVSNYLKEKLKLYGAKNIEVVYNFVDDSKFKQLNRNDEAKLREYYGVKKEDTVFTYIGRLDREKGVDKLLEALTYLNDRNDIKCFVVGNSFFSSAEEKKYNNKLHSILKNVNDKVTFTGYIDNSDLYKIYASSDCIVIPTQVEEAFGMVALEAMRMKKPVIASNSGALPEILSPQGSIIFEKKDIHALSEAIRRIASDKKIREKMGEKNYIAGDRFPHNIYEYFSLVAKSLS